MNACPFKIDREEILFVVKENPVVFENRCSLRCSVVYEGVIKHFECIGEKRCPIMNRV